MLVLASNTPEQLDWAINDRLDEMVEFALPGKSEVERLVYLYFDKYILAAAVEGGKGRKLKLEESLVSLEASKALCSEIAEKAVGMSGREIAKLGVAWQAAGYSSDDGILTKAMIMEKVNDALNSHQQKVKWLSEEEIRENRQVAYKSPKTHAATHLS